ncbi:hypothetical protein MNEG_7860 [Monoraphidium neglectum]|uniref:Serine/threonine-protein kinase ATR n=1 Tax=Monoraphidium neglectum TaxID=145388 RepID=A0A0D2M9X4_9CHLO|nr:hypothetical protein MNEG_7860 [Monoraphidium neglectum]KIZ00100.1 hypothetical protein MNEG_7860 [Monoraphidium neglectum]|eukprot:XP_013899119.1 hypothetical protein MNEG_7860 [Monoraphidium neglectum]
MSARKRAPESGRRLIDSFLGLHNQLVKLCPWQPVGTKANVRQASAKRDFPKLLGLLPLEVQVPVQALFSMPLPPSGGKAGGGGAPPPALLVPSSPTIAGLQDEVLLMTSLQRPKKITFVGSDGGLYPFLAKPKDDLRKDYRLMDFAGVLNALMARDPAARRRSIALRTYAVLPLADDCGILQWVDNLVAFKSACEEVYTAEKLYNRRQTPTQIRKLYDGFQGTRKADLLASVLSTLPPRMHKWLLARFPEPGAWLAARLGFTRTAAAWSMVGHVLGMGDRHGENIMIDATTGDIMHVDFGCLFDRGLTLEVPEMVPFRLTQNVADGCGVSGVEGGFRRAAEFTLQVLRTNRGALMTCAETFLADPLVEWTKQHRGAGQELDNPMAKDALATIEGRLSGTLLGVASIPTSQALSVEGQVARLISEAVDHENLGRMYIWWMPWF